MKISSILKTKETLSFEFFPPKDIEQTKILFETIKNLKKFNPDFISITDSSINAKTKHIALSKAINKKNNMNILIHLTCINNTKKELLETLRLIKKNKIENILALKGDKANFIKTAKDFNYASDLIKIIPKNFDIGIALHPQQSTNKDLYYIKKKIELGAKFGITQIFFDNNVFYRFIEKLKSNLIDIPVICGIMPVLNYNMFTNIIKKTGKIKIPKEFLNIIDKYSDKNEDFLKYSVEYTEKQIYELMKNNVNGIHFFTFNKAKSVIKIINDLKLWKYLQKK